MTSLTDMSVVARKSVVVLGVVFVVYLVLSYLFGFIVNSLRKPPPPFIMVAENAYGKIPSPKFGKLQNTSGFTFALESVEGRPPESTTAGKVYKSQQKIFTNRTVDRAREFARGLGFLNESTVSGKVMYTFFEPEDPLRRLTIDVLNMNYTLAYDYERNPSFFNDKDPDVISRDKMTADARNGITSIFDQSLLTGNIFVEYLKMGSPSGKLEKITGKNDIPLAVQLTFFRPNLDGYKIVTPTYYTSPVNLIYFPSTNKNKRYLSINYTFWPIATDSVSTYTLRTASEAWQDLQDGYGYIANLGNNNPSRVVIRNITLAYFDSLDYQDFLEPVFVFEGDNEFIAYVPAVSKELLDDSMR